MKKPQGLTSVKVREFAEDNLKNFGAMKKHYAENGEGCGIRINEVNLYVDIWNHVVAKNYNWKELDNPCRNEIIDCWIEETGEYQEVFE